MKILDVPQSGSQGGLTSSRNRFGQYRRRRSTPVQPRTAAQELVRARLAANSAAWRTLTDNQRAGWTDLGASMSRQDSLGQTHTFNGFMAFCSVNNHLIQCGDAAITDAPALVTPASLITLTPTAVAGGAHSLAYTVTPLPGSTKVIIEASNQVSAGRIFMRNFRQIQVSAAAAASPANIAAAYAAKFGVVIAGQRIFYRVRTYRAGFVSGPTVASIVAS